MSTSPGVSAKFSDDGRKLLTKGTGDVTLRIKYDDNPEYAGELFDQLQLLAQNGEKREKSMVKKLKLFKLVVLVDQQERTLPRMFPSNLTILILEIIPLKFLVITEETKMTH